jgi:hypothetical protein
MSRRRQYDGRRWNPETKRRLGIDEEGLEQLRVKSQRVLSSLERHMKRENRHLQTLVPPEEYEALMDAWKKHFRWMRLRLVYFKPLQPISAMCLCVGQSAGGIFLYLPREFSSWTIDLSFAGALSHNGDRSHLHRLSR